MFHHEEWGHIFEKISYSMTNVTLQDLRFWSLRDTLSVTMTCARLQEWRFLTCSMILLHSWKNIWDLLAAVHRRLKLQDLHFKMQLFNFILDNDLCKIAGFVFLTRVRWIYCEFLKNIIFNVINLCKITKFANKVY